MRFTLFICKYFWHKWIPNNEFGKCAFCQRCGATLDSYPNAIYAEDHNTIIGYCPPVSLSPMEVYLKNLKEFKKGK